MDRRNPSSWFRAPLVPEAVQSQSEILDQPVGVAGVPIAENKSSGEGRRQRDEALAERFACATVRDGVTAADAPDATNTWTDTPPATREGIAPDSKRSRYSLRFSSQRRTRTIVVSVLGVLLTAMVSYASVHLERMPGWLHITAERRALPDAEPISPSLSTSRVVSGGILRPSPIPVEDINSGSPGALSSVVADQAAQRASTTSTGNEASVVKGTASASGFSQVPAMPGCSREVAALGLCDGEAR